ncbi:MAG TPA: PEP-CTERM sorting domain-containing protein [Bryobacteraceae bacterium]|nr:PEP-CTERM sorting domain-containing protein [Bryobacteraceae bacterium]
MNIAANVACAAIIGMAMMPLASADTFNFSFTGGGITSSGTLTAVLAPSDTSGVTATDTYEVTGISGSFSDLNVGISGNITGLYLPLSYVTGVTATAANPVAFTSGGLSYDDLFFPLGNSPADCPGYPFSGGDLDVYGIAFNVSGGYVGEFFSNGILPGTSAPAYAAADANATKLLDNPNAGSHTGPVGVLGSFAATAVPEPGTLLLLGGGLALAAALKRLACTGV